MLKKRVIGVVLFASFGSILIVTPSYGFININDFLSSLISEVKGEAKKIETWAKSEVEKKWTGIKEDAKAAIESTIGEIGVPDPIASGNKLKREIADTYSLPVAQEKAYELERELTRASIVSVVGKSGQSETAQKIEKTTQIAQEAKTIATQAQGMDASQNVLKAISAQNALIVSMLAQQRTDSLQARQDTAQSNLMLTQIAEYLASVRNQENIEKEGSLSLVHELALNAVLDPTYK